MTVHTITLSGYTATKALCEQLQLVEMGLYKES